MVYYDFSGKEAMKTALSNAKIAGNDAKFARLSTAHE